jgi:hypothetical protein
MEYIVEKEQKVKKLTNEQKEDIAKNISEEFKTYDRARASQLDKATRLKGEIFFKSVAYVEKDESKKWKSRLKLCKMFMYHQILKAFIWKNTYANTNSMFDVSGESLESDNNSNKQKTALVDILEKMDYSKTLDKIIDNSLIYGELISFSTWKKQTEEYRRPVDFLAAIKEPQNILKMTAAKMKGKEYYIDERSIYDNPYIYYVDPANFVFDAAQKDEWDTCPKINRTWKTPEYIISNKYFELTNEQKKEIRELAKKTSDEQDLDSLQSEDNKDEISKGSVVEMLEHYGDLTLCDGTVLRNWYAVVIAGKYLVRFEKNPLVINPFSYGAYVTDPDNGRGISPLYSIYDISLTQEDMLRRTMDMQSLTENPPQFVAKGFYGEHPDDIELHPGKIIEYDQGLYPSLPIKQMEFAVNVFSDDLAYLGDLTSEISGIFPNMAGASESDRTTATEISTKVEGQLTRLKMLLDIINQYLILDNVKKVAKLKANFTFGNETVYINNENNPENVEITDEIRQGDYRYTYADRSATSERYNFADMVGQAVQMFIKSGLQLNIDEFFKWYMEQKGVENPERFVMDMNTISPEVQQALLQNEQLAPIIQEMENRVELAKQGKEDQIPDEGESEGIIQPHEEQPSFEDKLNSLPGRNLLSE